MFNQVGLSVSSVGGGGSVTGLMGKLIQTQTLASPASSVTFSAIPQTYTHLKLFVSSSVVTGGSFLQANFNGDLTAGNYFFNNLTTGFNGSLATTGGFSQAGAMVGSLNTNAGYSEANFFGYSNTTLLKGFFAHSIGSVFFTSGGLWNNVAAITSIVLTNSAGGNFNAGSIFSLYGIN